MNNDITRDTFHRVKHFSRVLMQQGRVQLDADWNEQVSILHHYLRTLTSDLLGSGAGPERACGFELIVEPTRLEALTKEMGIDPKKLPELTKGQIIISPGRYYVDGLLAENERLLSFGENNQPDAVKKIKETLEADDPLLLMYLDVWERHVTPIEDDEIREKALGGPDTATRAKIEWAIRARPFDDEIKRPNPVTFPPDKAKLEKWREDLDPQFEAWSQKQWTNRPRLRAGIEQQSESDDPCVCSPESVYRGPENQLYRVEIHRPGIAWDGSKGPDDKVPSEVATFKWSRDNASVAAAWLDDEDDTLKVSGARDQARGFGRGQWVELSDEQHDLAGTPGTLVQLKEAEAGSLTFDPTTADGSVLGRENFGSNAKVRRWDQKATEETSLTGGAIAIRFDKWFDLEDGVQVQFKASGGKEPDQFRSGDYWLIPARIASRDIEWPWESDAKEERRALLPHGIKHHHAMIGLLAATAPEKTLAFADLRIKFAPQFSKAP